MIDQIKLIELMSARMCHDLAGPIGAVNNSIEFFEEDNPDIKTKALEIIKSSSAESVLRLKFFRQAYGVLNDKETSVDEVQELIREFIGKTKVTLDWNNSNIKVIHSSIAKIILNFTIIALSSMIYGGIIEIHQSDNLLRIKFNGKNLIFSEETKDLLLGDLSKVTLNSSNIQTYFTHKLILNYNHKLSLEKDSDSIEFYFKGIDE